MEVMTIVMTGQFVTLIRLSHGQYVLACILREKWCLAGFGFFFFGQGRSLSATYFFIQKMCQEMEGVSRARELERSAVSDLSSLISDQRETSHPEGDQGNYLNCTIDHSPTSARSITAMGVGNTLWEGENQICVSSSTEQSFSKQYTSQLRANSGIHRKTKTLAQYIKTDHRELKLNKLSLELRLF